MAAQESVRRLARVSARNDMWKKADAIHAAAMAAQREYGRREAPKNLPALPSGAVLRTGRERDPRPMPAYSPSVIGKTIIARQSKRRTAQEAVYYSLSKSNSQSPTSLKKAREKMGLCRDKPDSSEGGEARRDAERSEALQRRKAAGGGADLPRPERRYIPWC